MKKIILFLFFLTTFHILKSCEITTCEITTKDRALINFLYVGQEQPIECTATYQEITQDFNRHYKKNALPTLRIFDVFDNNKYVCQKTYPEKISSIQLTASASDYKHENISADEACERLIHFYQKQGMVLEPSQLNNKLILFLDKSKTE